MSWAAAAVGLWVITIIVVVAYRSTVASAFKHPQNPPAPLHSVVTTVHAPPHGSAVSRPQVRTHLASKGTSRVIL
jgi:hypothetical protein